MIQILVLLSIWIATSECGIPFVYTEVDPHDPVNVAKLRDALTMVGVKTDGIKILTFFEKYEVLRDAYKSTYVNQMGQTCFIKWHLGRIVNSEFPSMPVCENSGISYLPPKRVVVVQPTPQTIIRGYYPPYCPSCGR